MLRNLVTSNSEVDALQTILIPEFQSCNNYAQHTRYRESPHVNLALGERMTSLADLCKHVKTSAVNHTASPPEKKE